MSAKRHVRRLAPRQHGGIIDVFMLDLKALEQLAVPPIAGQAEIVEKRVDALVFAIKRRARPVQQTAPDFLIPAAK